MTEPTAAGNAGSEVRVIHLTEMIEIYRDYDQETVSEGFAQVWDILEEDDEYYVLRVSFLSDPMAPGRKFIRKYRKRKPQKEGRA